MILEFWIIFLIQELGESPLGYSAEVLRYH